MSIRSESSINARPAAVSLFSSTAVKMFNIPTSYLSQKLTVGILNFALVSDNHAIEEGFGGYMSWAQITDLALRGHEFGACQNQRADACMD